MNILKTKIKIDHKNSINLMMVGILSSILYYVIYAVITVLVYENTLDSIFSTTSIDTCSRRILLGSVPSLICAFMAETKKDGISPLYYACMFTLTFSLTSLVIMRFSLTSAGFIEFLDDMGYPIGSEIEHNETRLIFYYLLSLVFLFISSLGYFRYTFSDELKEQLA